ncbi:hypothetical protein GGR51DRAFT_470229 [Nemania sp. FL0031]|nr:hypothetical protein GGR51DRAFT_470229 [Nemania sp. FL0031]
MDNKIGNVQWCGEDVSTFIGLIRDPYPYNPNIILGDWFQFVEPLSGDEAVLANATPEIAPSPPNVRPRFNLCGYQSNYEKDIVRHTRSKHSQPSDRVFQCRCGKTDCRKDNHKRHVRSCNKRSSIGKPYICECGAWYPNLEKYLDGLHGQGCAHPRSPSSNPGCVSHGSTA